MITMDLPGTLHCAAEEGCKETIPVQFFLMPSGGFGARWESRLWQVHGDKQNPFSPLMGRCPKHAVKLQVGPAGPRVVSAAR